MSKDKDLPEIRPTGAVTLTNDFKLGYVINFELNGRQRRFRVEKVTRNKLVLKALADKKP
jgi:hypothetical protein